MLHSLLSELGASAQKEVMVAEFTCGRTERSSGMTMAEAKAMLDALNTMLTERRKPFIKKIVGLMYGISEHLPHWKKATGGLNYQEALKNTSKKEANSLSDYKLAELPALLRQMQSMRRKYGKKRNA